MNDGFVSVGIIVFGILTLISLIVTIFNFVTDNGMEKNSGYVLGVSFLFLTFFCYIPASEVL
jgi:hypothetical protein